MVLIRTMSVIEPDYKPRGATQRQSRMGSAHDFGAPSGRRLRPRASAEPRLAAFHCIEVYADFSGQGKNYAQFPDRQRFRIYMQDLRPVFLELSRCENSTFRSNV